MNTITELIGGNSRKLKGNEVLSVKPGAVLIVTKNPKDSLITSKYVLRTESIAQPLLALASGNLWGDELSGYEFEIVTNPITITPSI